MAGPGQIAVLDVGKSNVKLSACTADGDVVETLSTPNPVLPGPPWRHHDLQALNAWVLAGLADLARRHPLGHVVASGHGSGGVLVGDDPDAGGDGIVLPMVDYEQPLPAGMAETYAPLAGGFFDRGSAIMMAATHTARQMFWAETARPDDFARARWCLGIPQYWAWRLSGVAVSEATILGAQSDLGPIRPALAARHGLPAGLRIHAGVHDSSANFYRYQSAGMTDLCVVSTGTWIVAMADRVDLSRLDEARGMTCNADVSGAPLGGALTMGGREYATVAGDQPPNARADAATLARLVAQGSMALPTFGSNDGQFPGSAGQGRLVGPPPQSAAERHALAVIYTALLTLACADRLDPDRRLVLDGSFLRDPAFAALVAALRPGRETLVNPAGNGIAAGAARLCSHGSAPAPLTLHPPAPLPGLPDLTEYAARWRVLAKDIPT
jgi:sugar (pentulose or hexulose) kinase